MDGGGLVEVNKLHCQLQRDDPTGQSKNLKTFSMNEVWLETDDGSLEVLSAGNE